MSNRFLLSIEDESRRAEHSDALRSCSITAAAASLDSINAGERVEGAQAAIVEIQGTSGARLDLVRAIRTAYPEIPILCALPEADASRLDELYQLRVEVCGAPLAIGSLLRFVERARTLPPVGGAALSERIRKAAAATGLSRRETELLALATEGLPRRAIAEALSVSENTVKAQVRSLLKKTGARSLAVLGQQVLRGATTTAPSAQA